MKYSNVRVFQKVITPFPKKLPAAYQSTLKKQKRKFRSFFGLLKAKPFIKESRFNLLNFLKINPRRRTLQAWVQKTKQIHTNNLVIFEHQQWEFTKNDLLGLLRKFKHTSLAKYRYELFKHKIHSKPTS